MWYFLIFVLLIISLIWWVFFTITNPIHNINDIKNLIKQTPTTINNWFIKKNKITLKTGDNQAFFLKDLKKINIQANTDEQAKKIEIDFINLKSVWKWYNTLKNGTDFKIDSCSNSDCIMEKNNDIEIYKVTNNDPKIIKYINEIIVEAKKMQQWEISFLLKDKNWNVIYNYWLLYILKTGDNSIRFPTIDLKDWQILYIKMKIIDDNYSI